MTGKVSIDSEISEAKLREMENRYRSIFENSSEGIFQTSVEGKYLAVNPALGRIYGYESADDLMAQVSDIAAQLYVEPHRRAEFQAAMAERGEVKDFVSEIHRKDGAKIWIRENAHVVRGHDGEILYYEGWVEDVTEKRRAEAELLSAKLAAEEASRAKTEFLEPRAADAAQWNPWHGRNSPRDGCGFRTGGLCSHGAIERGDIAGARERCARFLQDRSGTPRLGGDYVFDRGCCR